MKIEKRLLNRVEGEVELKLVWNGGKVKDAFVCAPNFRGFERLLRGKPLLDALVITPRVCGICGHAHLSASVRAIENIYERMGRSVEVSDKAKNTRLITLLCEIIQNHIRWFFLYLMPDVVKLKPSLEELYSPLRGSLWRESIKASNLPIKVIALFGGQWPHTSYMYPGGVMSDPTSYEISQALSFIGNLKAFLSDKLLGVNVHEYVERNTSPLRLGGSVGHFLEAVMNAGLKDSGRSYRRFLVGGLEGVFPSGVVSEELKEFRPELVSEGEEFTFFKHNGKGYTWSKSARYDGQAYETGPLARQVTSRREVFRELLDSEGDTFWVRVLARIDELVRATLKVEKLLRGLDLGEPSWVKPGLPVDKLSGKGVGIVEAARGTLIHEVEVEKGVIKSYNIITPTVWNLGPRDNRELGVVEKAIVGAESFLEAELILRSFDVCSVCTSH